MVELERCDDCDFFVLVGTRNWSSVEGSADEWLAIAEALDGMHNYVASKRCALAKERPTGWVLWSPRNRSGPHDCVRLNWSEGAALADQIRETLAAEVFGAWA